MKYGILAVSEGAEHWVKLPFNRPLLYNNTKEAAQMASQLTAEACAHGIHDTDYRARKYNDTGYSPTAICELYDRNPNLTLAQLSDITGRTVKQLKRILLGASR